MATNCEVKINRLSSMWQDAEKRSVDPLKGKSGITPDAFWRTVNGHSLQTVGPGTPELNPSDLLSLYNRVQRYGNPGRQLVDKTKRAQEMVDINSSMYEWRALQFLDPLKTEAEWINLREVMEQRSAEGLKPGERMPPTNSKRIEPLNENVRMAAEFLNSQEGSGGLLDHLAGVAQRDGLLNQRIENYWPIIYPTQLLEDVQFRQSAVGSFAKEQARLRLARERGVKPGSLTVTDADIQPMDRENAQLIFNRYVLPQYAAVAPHLELGREWDVAGQINDPRVLIPTYIKQMWRRIAEKRTFGERDHMHDFPREAKQLLGQIQSEHGQAAHDEALRLVQDFVGLNPSDPVMNSVIMRTLSNMQGLKLTASALRNFSQHVNTVLRGDFESLGKAFGLYLKNGQLNGYNVRELAKDIASAADLALYDSSLYRPHDRFGRVVEKTLQYTGFTPVEKYNRVFAGISGAVYADKQARRLLEGGKDAAQRLLELGIDPNLVRERGGIDPQDMLLAGRRFIDETQFRTRAGELPFFAKDPLWKFLLQFRTFSINQTNFIVREIQRRPARTLMFALGAMPMVGFASDFAQDVAMEMLPWFEPRMREKRGLGEAYVESWAAAGGFGLVSDFAWATWMAGESKMFANFFMPPGFGTLNDTMTVAGELARGKGTQAFRDFSRQFGGLGSAFGRYISPSQRRKDFGSSLDELDDWLDG